MCVVFIILVFRLFIFEKKKNVMLTAELFAELKDRLVALRRSL